MESLMLTAIGVMAIVLLLVCFQAANLVEKYRADRREFQRAMADYAALRSVTSDEWGEVDPSWGGIWNKRLKVWVNGEGLEYDPTKAAAEPDDPAAGWSLYPRHHGPYVNGVASVALHDNMLAVMQAETHHIVERAPDLGVHCSCGGSYASETIWRQHVQWVTRGEIGSEPSTSSSSSNAESMSEHPSDAQGGSAPRK